MNKGTRASIYSYLARTKSAPSVFPVARNCCLDCRAFSLRGSFVERVQLFIASITLFAREPLNARNGSKAKLGETYCFLDIAYYAK